ncbi:helix-turn-helix transcriptional regulator [Streptomyces turgidiscabies]|uniref:DNA-binding helix-turn-helix protein n=1 Tax=Streptomyces turgidiscabies (strain Car8) TaxID=698760 RepID=L7ETT8_STRT8|nr:helix-turn-helix transcriptional regulator [Streptomyces turgidiscabies]ELP62833.1 DNA-binding helix-turn-helix protein [Streptomyces turgidiscabies Car8]MDX3493245.1 helix-turn-helix transcriptional regulator [Streptomyces turgidiscabies]
MKPNGLMIRGIRTGRKLSLRELEARTGLNRGYLSRLEREQMRDVGSEQVRRVAEALRVPEALLIDTEESTP